VHTYIRTSWVCQTTKEQALKHTWTIQRFTTVAGRPWFALHKQDDSGVIWAITGYRWEIDAFIRQHGIQAEELPGITEEEYFSRMEVAA
jgi:hypothetical protein